MSSLSRRQSFGMSRSRGGVNTGGSAHINLTPMIDLMTIMLVFLIKSYSTDPAYLTPTANIELAQTTSEKVAPNEAVIIIGKDGLLVDGKLIVKLKDGAIESGEMQKGLLPALQTALQTMADKTRAIAEKNSTVKFSGTLILQADKQLPFDSLKPILRTAGVVGFNDIKFAGVYLE